MKNTKASISHIPAPIKKAARTIAAALFWLAIWHIAAKAVGKEILIAPPDKVLARLTQLFASYEYWAAVLSSLARVFSGFGIGFVCAIVLSVLSAVSALLDALISPLITAVKATPVASFIILALVWLDTSAVPVFTSALMVAPVVYSASLTAIRQTDIKLLEMARVYTFSPLKTAAHIYLPSMTPHIRAAAVTALGLSWKAGIAAEVLCMPRGSVGRYLYESKIYLETTDLFAWTLTVIAASLILEYIIRAAIGAKQKNARGTNEA